MIFIMIFSLLHIIMCDFQFMLNSLMSPVGINGGDNYNKKETCKIDI